MDEVGRNASEAATRPGCEGGTLSRLLNGKVGVSATMAPTREDIGWGTSGPARGLSTSPDARWVSLLHSLTPSWFAVIFIAMCVPEEMGG